MSGSTLAASPPLEGPRVRAPGDPWRGVSWNEALERAATDLVQVTRAGGADAIAVYVGRSARSATQEARALARTLGAARVFIHAEPDEAALGWATRRALGHPSRLVPDLDRAHHVLWLGPGLPGWPDARPIPAGFRRSLTVAHARPFPARIHLAIRPGSETFLVLGLAHTILARGWHDAQYVRDWTTGTQAAVAALEPWTPERCATRCGIPSDLLVAEALRFARAPMAVATGHPGIFRTPHGGLLAWGLILLHAATANALRPGGLYARPPGSGHVVLPGGRSWRSGYRASGGHPAVLTPMDLFGPPDPPRVLVAAGGLPTDDYGPAIGAPLDELEQLVQIGTRTTILHPRTRWIFPGQGEPGGQPIEEVLSALRTRIAAARFGFAPRPGLQRTLDQATDLLLDGHRHLWRHLAPVQEAPGGHEDRAFWDVGYPDGRLHLDPPPPLRDLSDAWPDPKRPLVLFEGDPAPEEVPRLRLHPEVGPRDGDLVGVDTPSGSFEARIERDPSLRLDTAEVSALPALAGALHVLDGSTGEPWRHGVPCHIDTPSSRRRRRGPT
ncbi:MAG: molybdopterin-dependent oxidoreductase [Deltaproteobacteria bacterium]|nr:molybdopterin-dependent oxidoreductase [Deltaproteobacteria bacterium]